MSIEILSRFTYSLEVKRKIFLQAFESERCVEDSELQVAALPETFSAKMKTRNRAPIGHLIDTLKFLGQLGISFRGHRDSGRLEPVSDIKGINTSTGNFLGRLGPVSDIKGINTSTGNFRAILQLHLMENSKLVAHLEESSFNATNLSLDIQNQLITLTGEGILSTISFEVKNAFCFVGIANETTDKSIKRQLSVVVRYFKDNILTERCIGMINQSNLKGKALADTILSHLKSLNLYLEKMIGQAYDEASSMSGKERHSSDCKRILPTSCLCLLLGTCNEYSIGKILSNT